MTRRRWIAALALALAGCSTVAPVDDARRPRQGPPVPFAGKREPVALVLSGGSARGFAHAGVLQVLEENGLRPDIIVGSSAGALFGALHAAGVPAAELPARLAGIDAALQGDPLWPRLGALPGALGLVSGERLRRFLEERLPVRDLERFPVRFAAVATDLDLGVAVAFDHGDAARAIGASMAVPVLYEPVRIGDCRFVDGQVASPVPVDAARRLGARRVIAVDVIYPPDDSRLTSAMRVLFQAFLVSTYQLRGHQLRGADLVITPRIPATSGQFGVADRDMLVAAGREAAQAALPGIRELMAASRAEGP